MRHASSGRGSGLTFGDQKNRERGEVIAHTRSGHSVACPTRTLIRRLRYLRRYGAEVVTLLCAYRQGNRWQYVTSKAVTNLIKTSAAACLTLGFSLNDVNARSPRSGGAMALLCGRAHCDVIRLVGRPRPDAMFRYLHAQAQALPLIRNLAFTMLNHGVFTLACGAYNPARANQIIQASPDATVDN
jgi:hypothetical protein